MDILNELRGKGWHLTLQGLKTIESNSDVKNNVEAIKNAAMNLDFREIAEGGLRSQRHGDVIKGPLVLQIQKIRNIAAPKANEDSTTCPRLLCIELSDGQTSIKAIELVRISALNPDMPPGTKVLFKPDRMQLVSGFITLRGNEMEILGGKVEVLIEKWELSRTLQQYARDGPRPSGGSGGPPSWVPFGKSLNAVIENSGLPIGQDFKSLQLVVETKDTKDNEAFIAMRNEAIVEAVKTGSKRIFGGGGQTIVDHNVKKIMDDDFTEDEAKLALRQASNNFQRALRNLRRQRETRLQRRENGPQSGSSRGGIGGREMGGRRGMANSKDEVSASKPATNVSLFDFLTDKLPTNNNVSDAQNAVNNNSNSQNASYKSEKPAFQTTSTSSTSNAMQYSNSRSNHREYNQNDFRNGRSVQDSTINQSSNYNRRDQNTNRNSTRGRPNSNYRNNDRNNQDQSLANTITYDGGRNNNRGRGGEGDRGRSRNYDGTNRSSNPREFGGGNTGNNNNSNYNKQPTMREQQTTNNLRNNNKPSDSAAPTKSTNERNPKPESMRYRREPREQAQQQQQKKPPQQPYSPPPMQQQTLAQSPSTQYSTTTGVAQIGQQFAQKQAMYIAGAEALAAMANLNISNNINYNAGNQSNQPMVPSGARMPPSGFNYDPSKIIGFQTKEANEYAMNLLKSQGKSGATAAQQNVAQQQLHQQQLPPQPQQYQFPSPPQQQHFTAPQPPPSPMQNYIMQQPPRPVPSQYGGMVAGGGWAWKIGDLCMAKYWDDGQYYEAEIKGVSETTCVVFFVGYGNHEEVLKEDCLPITDANHQPINTFNQPPPTGIAHAAPPQYQQQAAYARNNSHRYRNERQVYVPPPKREN